MMMETLTVHASSPTISTCTPFVMSVPPKPSWIEEMRLPFICRMPSTERQAMATIFSTTSLSMTSVLPSSSGRCPSTQVISELAGSPASSASPCLSSMSSDMHSSSRHARVPGNRRR